MSAVWICVACGLRQDAAALSCRNCRAAHPDHPELGARDDELEIPISTPLRAAVQVVGLLAFASLGALAIQRSARLSGVPGPSEQVVRVDAVAPLRALADALDARVAGLESGQLSAERAPLASLRSAAGLDAALAGPPRVRRLAAHAERCVAELAAAERLTPFLPPSQRAAQAARVRASLGQLREALDGSDDT